MKKRWNRCIAVLLVLIMLLSMTACGGKNSGTTEDGPRDLSWLNTDGTLPIVEEGTEKTLKIAIQMYSDSGDPETQWFYKFIEKEMNINLEITKLSSGAEQLTLMFADGDLPDIIIGAGLDSASLMRYGADEEMLADLAPYITEELTPNLYKLYSENPEYKDAVADKDGHIWSLGYINDTTDRGQISRAFINYDWLEDAGLSTPATLDEFVNMLKTFKSRGDNITPMGGSWEAENPLLILLNAFGYITENPKGMDIALRNGEVVLPIADREAYGEYIKLLRELYKEGLIHENFFTMNLSSVKTMIAQGECGYVATAPFTYTADYTSWWGAQPLTSNLNNTAQWPQGTDSALTSGGFVVSADSENKELAMAFADWFFEESGTNYNMSTNGPAATQTEYIYDDVVTGFEIDEETYLATFPGYVRKQNNYSSKNDYAGKEIYLWGYRLLGLGKGSESSNIAAIQYGYTPDEIVGGFTDVTVAGIQGEVRKETAKDGDMAFRLALEDTMVPYVTKDTLPTAYLDAETVSKLSNLWTLVKEYASQETANFVVGRRELTDAELDKYFNEIEALGATEIVNAYKEYYGK